MNRAPAILRRAVGGIRKRWSRHRYKAQGPSIRKHWQDSLPGEVEFWRRFIDAHGPWSDELTRRLDPNEPLESWVRSHLDASDGAPVEILDVGAGPLTSLGKTWPGRQVRITAIDPLADEYNALLREKGVTPPVSVLPGEAEDLLSLFGAERFDLVHFNNALDHCHDPLIAIQQALAVVKSGGHVLLHHLRREADNRGFTGMHQWNFDVRNGHFIISDAWKETDVAVALGHVAGVEVSLDADKEKSHHVWVRAVLRKLSR